MSAPVLLEARDLWMEYEDAGGTHAVLRGAELVVHQGEFIGLMGPSGSGKSTLLLLLAGLRAATQGRITFMGEPWPRDLAASALRRRKLVGFVFQEPFLISHLTVRENAWLQALDGSARAGLEGLARRLGLDDLLDRFPHELSGGQRQRASILRALINTPSLIVADEPTAWLDREGGRQVMEMIAHEAGKAALIVCTHDRDMLWRAHRLLEMRDGQIAESLPARPESAREP
jgi:ABC-type lipoprotein export system ATPase subunit